MNNLTKNITIDRKKWLRSKNKEEQNSYLLRKSDGKQCCLGQMALQCGFSKNDIIGQRSPVSIGWRDLMVAEDDSPTAHNMIICNDNPRTTDAQKEKRLKYLAKYKLGVTLKFVN